MFEFDATEIITKKEFDLFVNKQKKDFLKKRNSLFEEYNFFVSNNSNYNLSTYQEFRKKYNMLVQINLKKVIRFFRSYLPEHCLIVEFGSFAKGTERLFSDLDFTICYDEQKTMQYEVAEELIDYALAVIFDYSIDHIHGKFQHYPDMPEVYCYTEKDNLYCLIFNDGIIEYKCGPETLCENIMNIKNVRDYKSMIAGYEEKYLKKCNIDCLYSIKILENSTEHDFLNDLSELESKYNICEGYKFNLVPYNIKDEFQISEVKKLLKNNGIVELYIFISSLRKKTGFCDGYSMTIDKIWKNSVLINVFGNVYLDSLRQAFLEFIFYWNRLEYSLVKRGIPLSTRCYKKITLKTLNFLLIKDWGKSTYFELVVKARNNLIELVGKGLSII